MKNRESPPVLVLIRDNIFGLVIVSILTFLVDYRDIFAGSDEIYYVAATAIFLFGLMVLFDKYRNPFRYNPAYFLFVKDRDEQLIRMEPFLDPLMTRLGFIKPEEFVNVRYTIYPELDVGLDMDPSTGIITGYPLEVGNHTSQVKMKYLGGEFSTKIRVEVVKTLKHKTPRKSEVFAPPRTVAQLLIREEDLSKRESEINYRIEDKKKDLEAEYITKSLALDEKFDVERQSFKEALEERDKLIENFESEMEGKINAKVAELTDAETDLKRQLKASEERVAELELLVAETRAAAADIEEDYIQMFDTLATGSDGEVVEEVKEEIKEEVKEEVVEEEPDEEEYDYVSMTKAELVELAKKRGVPISGNKKKIISRLEGS